MSRFDGPHFDKEDSNIVSIWASKVPNQEIPEDYFTDNYSEDDEEPFNQFSSDFGIGCYDHDFTENSRDYGDTNEQKLMYASYGKSFCKEASLACDIQSVGTFYLMYDFIYDPKVTRINESKYFKFIGCFKFDKNA
jgi:hypothetical protein